MIAKIHIYELSSHKSMWTEEHTFKIFFMARGNAEFFPREFVPLNYCVYIKDDILSSYMVVMTSMMVMLTPMATSKYVSS
jgi:hypothetical protein